MAKSPLLSPSPSSPPLTGEDIHNIWADRESSIPRRGEIARLPFLERSLLH
jgi:hypothetical protein